MSDALKPIKHIFSLVEGDQHHGQLPRKVTPLFKDAVLSLSLSDTGTLGTVEANPSSTFMLLWKQR